MESSRETESCGSDEFEKLDTSQITSRFQEFCKQNEVEARKIVNEEVLRKIVSLWKVLEKTKSERNSNSTEENQDIHQRSETSKKYVNFLKREFVELIELGDTVKLFTALNVPALDDSRKFETSIQRQIIGEIVGSRVASDVVLSTMLREYVNTRAKLIENLNKHPSSDAEHSIKSLDSMHLIYQVRWIEDLAHVYLMLHDMLQKNDETLSTVMQWKDQKTGSHSNKRNRSSVAPETTSIAKRFRV